MLSLYPPFEQPIAQQFLFDMITDKGIKVYQYIYKYFEQQKKLIKMKHSFVLTTSIQLAVMCSAKAKLDMINAKAN